MHGWKKNTAQKTFVDLQDMLKTSSRHALKASSTQQFFVFQHVFKMSWKLLQDVLRKHLPHVFKLSLRNTSSRFTQDAFRSSRKIRSCYAEDVFKMLSRRLQDMSGGRRQTKYLLGRNLYLSLRNINLDLTNFYLINLCLTNLRRIQNKSMMH